MAVEAFSMRIQKQAESLSVVVGGGEIVIRDFAGMTCDDVCISISEIRHVPFYAAIFADAESFALLQFKTGEMRCCTNTPSKLYRGGEG